MPRKHRSGRLAPAKKALISPLYAARRLRAILALLRVRDPSPGMDAVELALVGSKRMRDLNRHYRGKDASTDVLSFPAPEAWMKQGVLGQIVIAMPVLARQAREQGHSARVELDVLLVHGVLHLLGYDHERSALEAKRQARRESFILKRLGLSVASGLIRRSS